MSLMLCILFTLWVFEIVPLRTEVKVTALNFKITDNPANCYPGTKCHACILNLTNVINNGAFSFYLLGFLFNPLNHTHFGFDGDYGSSSPTSDVWWPQIELCVFQYDLINKKKQDKKKGYVNSGQIVLKTVTIEQVRKNSLKIRSKE